jgi:hypothetical protein
MVKASLRTKSVGTKVSDAEYAQLEGIRQSNAPVLRFQFVIL